MPSRWAQGVIVLFWLAMTGWLVQRDLLPSWGYGEVTYRSLLAHRAVEEAAHWTIFDGDEKIGSVLTVVKPLAGGGYRWLTRAGISSELLNQNLSGRIVLASELGISPIGRLETVELRLSLENSELLVKGAGQVVGEDLVLTTSGLGPLDGEVRIPIAPEALLLDSFGPIDRLPDLRAGKAWSTRVMNPLSALFSREGWLTGGPTFYWVTHRVVGTTAIDWQGQVWDCYMVEHKQEHVTAYSWVRIRDDRVLKEEVPFGRHTLTFVLEPVREPRDE